MSTQTPTDEDAWFEQLFRSTRADVLGYLTRRADPADAADLLAEVYLVAWRRRTDLPKGSERLWLFGAARLLLTQHHSQQARTRHLCEDLAQRKDPGNDEDRWPDQTHSDSSCSPDAAAVRNALKDLSDLDRELIRLTAWEQLSAADAAQVMGITPTSARVRLHRARRRLATHPDLLRLLGTNPLGAAKPRNLQTISDPT